MIDSSLRGGLMVCGTTSDAGKSQFVTGLCRLLARNGISVAPFKAQNMALNSYVTPSGHEIGRAQGVQALAASIEPEVGMNPVLLKPTSDRASQVVVMGEPQGHLDAAAYHEHKPRLLGLVLEALGDLRARYDVVVVEGAGSPAEINLLDHDIVNLRIAHDAGLPAVIVGDIDRGGVFAALFGTVALLPDHYRELVRGFVINKFRGDPALLGDGLHQLETRSGVPTLGVLPYLSDIALDSEDSLALDGLRPRPDPTLTPGGATLDVAVVRLPRLSNFTDLDALSIEPGVAVRYVDDAASLGRPDLVIIPGTKATVADLEWLRAKGLHDAIDASHAMVLGLCGGYQMMGRRIVDGVESGQGAVDGLGWLEVETTFEATKVTRRRAGIGMGETVTGYQIHHGRVTRTEPDEADPTSGALGWLQLDDRYGDEVEGAVDPVEARFLGTTLHGLFEQDDFRAVFLREMGRRSDKRFVPAGVSFAEARLRQFDRLADLIEAHVDLDRLVELITQGRPTNSHEGARA